jgi:hypothetical protein
MFSQQSPSERFSFLQKALNMQIYLSLWSIMSNSKGEITAIHMHVCAHYEYREHIFLSQHCAIVIIDYE